MGAWAGLWDGWCVARWACGWVRWGVWLVGSRRMRVWQIDLMEHTAWCRRSTTSISVICHATSQGSGFVLCVMLPKFGFDMSDVTSCSKQGCCSLAHRFLHHTKARRGGANGEAFMAPNPGSQNASKNGAAKLSSTVPALVSACPLMFLRSRCLTAPGPVC